MSKSPPLLPTRIFLLLLLAVSIFSCKKGKDKPAEEPLPVFGTCQPVAASGRLTIIDDNHFTYTTTGGAVIDVDFRSAISIKHNNYPNFRLDYWGESDDGRNLAGTHESLSGKHIKDWTGNRRTIVFPDGAKATFVSGGLYQPLLSITIYDGNDIHHYNAQCHKLEYSASSARFVKQLDDRDADGETCSFEITQTGLIYKNLYNETTPGNKVAGEQKLGQLYRDDAHHVDDFYDDPRRSDT